MTTIIDYDAGNIKSVEKAVEHLGESAVVTRDADRILSADRVILPGVGAFGDAMERLREYGLIDVIRQVYQKGTPFLGICLGLQLIFESSEESPGVEGLCLLPGKIKKLPESPELKIPNIGWNSLSFPKGGEEGSKRGRLFEGVPEGSFVYFVHSYYLEAADRDIVTAQIEYGALADVSVESGNLFACQFHPEKSSDTGLRILKNFLTAA